MPSVLNSPRMGRVRGKRGRVLYINLEIQSAFFAKRLRAISDERQVKIEKGWLRVWNMRGHAADMSKRLPRMLGRIRPNEYELS